jgi:hypothetical protein
MEEILTTRNIPFLYHETKHYYKFPWTDGKLYVATAEKKIRGPNWGYAGINELTLISVERYREVIGRVRLKRSKCSQIVSSGTPEGMASDYYQIFVEKPMDGSKCLYGDTRQNIGNLNPQYIKNLENSYDSKMLDAYMRGLWVNLNSNRFYYAYDQEKNCYDSTKIFKDGVVNCDSVAGFDGRFHVFLDFNVEHMTASVFLFNGRLFGVDEIVIDNNADTRKMAQSLKYRGYHPGSTVIYPDPAGKARSTKGKPDHDILRDEGFYMIEAKSIAPPFRQRQLHVNNLLEKQMIMIDKVKQPTLHKDLLAVEQDKVTLEKSKKNPALTHASDGLDYGCDNMFEFTGRKQPENRIVKHR